MKILAKTLLVASAIALPAVGYTEPKHSGHQNQNSLTHEQHMEKIPGNDNMCRPGEKCPMADDTEDMTHDKDNRSDNNTHEGNSNHNH